MKEAGAGCPLVLNEKREGIGDNPFSFYRRLQKNLGQNKVSVISEVKRMSPSKGLFKHTFKPHQLLRLYDLNQTTCLSVLTDQRLFGGDLSHLASIKRRTDLPVLRKDFLISKLQLLSTFLAGADAALAIVAILSVEQMNLMHSMALMLGLSMVFEVNSGKDVWTALGSGCQLIGVNNRDINTFTISFPNSKNLINIIPSNCIIILESGVRSALDVNEFVGHQFCCFLVGEFFVTPI